MMETKLTQWELKLLLLLVNFLHFTGTNPSTYIGDLSSSTDTISTSPAPAPSTPPAVPEAGPVHSLDDGNGAVFILLEVTVAVDSNFIR